MLLMYHSSVLYHAQVDYYGAPTPLKSLASIAVPDASTLLISPFDKGGLKDIEKAINESDIGINPSNDGEKIRLVIPAMTQVGHRPIVHVPILLLQAVAGSSANMAGCRSGMPVA